jgi:hypothetical protein
MPDTPLIRELHARWKAGDDPVETRAKEDEAAITSLGAGAERLVYWSDCIYRLSPKGDALYPTQESIFGEIHPDDVAGRLLHTMVLPPYQNVRVIYAPLGAGNHVDHQIVRNWGIELRKQYRWVALKFYEEYPYTEEQNAVVKAQEWFVVQQPTITLEAELVKLDEADVAAKIRSIGHYHSQIETFWTDGAAMEATTRAAMQRVGGGEPAERLWHIVS